LSHL